MVNIAVIGSREYKDKLKVWGELQKHIRFNYNSFEVTIISGGARGVDTWAEKWAKAKGIKTEIIKPINKADKLSYLLRNVEIVTKADKIIAFWDGKSRGTKFTIDYALARHKPVEIIEP